MALSILKSEASKKFYYAITNLSDIDFIEGGKAVKNKLLPHEDTDPTLPSRLLRLELLLTEYKEYIDETITFLSAEGKKTLLEKPLKKAHEYHTHHTEVLNSYLKKKPQYPWMKKQEEQNVHFLFKLIIFMEGIIEGKLMPTQNEQKTGAQQFSFPTDTLKDIFYPAAIEPFIEYENGLIKKGYFDKEKKWCKDKNELAAMVLKLQSNGYLKPIRTKSKHTATIHYRKFFELRYSTTIGRQLQPAFISKHKLHEVYIINMPPSLK